jgi:hypothetical protein
VGQHRWDQPHTADVRALETSQFHVANATTLFEQNPVAVLYVASVSSFTIATTIAKVAEPGAVFGELSLLLCNLAANSDSNLNQVRHDANVTVCRFHGCACRCGRTRQNRRPVPRVTRAAESGEGTMGTHFVLIYSYRSTVDSVQVLPDGDLRGFD